MHLLQPQELAGSSQQSSRYFQRCGDLEAVAAFLGAVAAYAELLLGVAWARAALKLTKDHCGK
jgi:hypothetical protein